MTKARNVNAARNQYCENQQVQVGDSKRLCNVSAALGPCNKVAPIKPCDPLSIPKFVIIFPQGIDFLLTKYRFVSAKQRTSTTYSWVLLQSDIRVVGAKTEWRERKLTQFKIEEVLFFKIMPFKILHPSKFLEVHINCLRKDKRETKVLKAIFQQLLKITIYSHYMTIGSFPKRLL